MATAKTIQQLASAQAVNADDELALAQQMGAEAAKVTVRQLADTIGAWNADGPLAEANLAMAALKNGLAEALTNKGVPSSAAETGARLVDKLNDLNVDTEAENLLSAVPCDISMRYFAGVHTLQTLPEGGTWYTDGTSLYHTPKLSVKNADITSSVLINNADASIVLENALSGYGMLFASRNGKYVGVYDNNNAVVQFYSFDADTKSIMHIATLDKPANFPTYSTTGRILFADSGQFFLWSRSGLLYVYHMESATISTISKSNGNSIIYDGVVDETNQQVYLKSDYGPEYFAYERTDGVFKLKGTYRTFTPFTSAGYGFLSWLGQLLDMPDKPVMLCFGGNWSSSYLSNPDAYALRRLQVRVFDFKTLSFSNILELSVSDIKSSVIGSISQSSYFGLLLTCKATMTNGVIVITYPWSKEALTYERASGVLGGGLDMVWISYCKPGSSNSYSSARPSLQSAVLNLAEDDEYIWFSLGERGQYMGNYSSENNNIESFKYRKNQLVIKKRTANGQVMYYRVHEIAKDDVEAGIYDHKPVTAAEADA